MPFGGHEAYLGLRMTEWAAPGALLTLIQDMHFVVICGQNPF